MDTNKLKYLFSKKRKKSNKLMKIKQESNYDEDLELAIALSKSLEISNNESIDFIKNNINNNEDQITQIHDLDHQIKKQISSLGGNQVLQNEGGGNCLFLSLSTHLNIPYNQLREDSVNYITSCWERFKDFALNPNTLLPFSNANEYKKYMSKDGSWGDHLSLLSLCELYQVNAVLVITDGKNLQEPIKINVGSKINILIKFSSEIHYEAII
tara:strand:- start:680 stop:1315 length:636 start_codon:yes stop_codon:yes gene_type:complete